jgi:hypothetical protein
VPSPPLAVLEHVDVAQIRVGGAIGCAKPTYGAIEQAKQSDPAIALDTSSFEIPSDQYDRVR